MSKPGKKRMVTLPIDMSDELLLACRKMGAKITIEFPKSFYDELRSQLPKKKRGGK